jgi:LAO/AO transport system kinase
MQTLIRWRREHGHWDRTRASQARHWFQEEVRRGLLSVLEQEPQKGLLSSLGDRVSAGGLTPEAAAAEFLTLIGRAR